MTQNDMILEHFRQIGSITAAEAMQKYGIGRLAARIADLRKAGYKIVSEDVKGRNRYGRRIKYARYMIAQNSNPGDVSIPE